MSIQIDQRQGLIAGVMFIPSPNADERPDGLTVDTLIIHAISLPPGEFGGPGIEQLFTNQLEPDAHPYYQEIAGSQVSAHLLIKRTGEIIQFVPFNKRAWHAGESECEGRQRVNDFSIGIELEGADDRPFEDIQYRRLGDVTKAILASFPAITADRIFGHEQIAPGRKTDPGPHFNWDYYRQLFGK